MKIKRFFAPDMRQAIRQVRDTFGPDAVILSNKTLDDGVELVAAMDYDDSKLESQLQAPPPPVIPPQPARPRMAEVKPAPAAAAPAVAPSRSAGQAQTLADLVRARPAPSAPANPRASATDAPNSPLLEEMRAEMQALRRMMENEMSELAWWDLSNRRPLTKELLRRLLGLDLHPELCQELANQVSDQSDPDQAYRRALTLLAARLPANQTDFLEQGGAVALIGPTGVGKTTTVAKLAARFCLRHGNRQLALITTDNYRIGAEEQLHLYGRILDVPVRAVADQASLNTALNLFSDRRLILIDTAGMGQRDVRLGEQIALLRRGNRPIHTLLTLAATTQAAALENAVRAFAAAQPSACVVTKVDEACSLGGLLTTLAQHRLPMAFSTDGQKVPEDIHIGRPHSLISRAVELARQAGNEIGEELLAYKLGGSREHAHG